MLPRLIFSSFMGGIVAYAILIAVVDEQGLRLIAGLRQQKEISGDCR
jgi:hypothetical protein